MLEAIRAAEAPRPHPVLHLPLRRLGPAVHRRARASARAAGVEVRFLYDSVGSYNLSSRAAPRAHAARREGRRVPADPEPALPAAGEPAQPPQDPGRGRPRRVHRRAEHRRRVPRHAPEVRVLARHALPGRRAGGGGLAAGVPGGLVLRDRTRRSTGGDYFPKFDQPARQVAGPGGPVRPGRGVQGDPRDVLRRHPDAPQAGLDRQPVLRARRGPARRADARGRARAWTCGSWGCSGRTSGCRSSRPATTGPTCSAPG